MTIKSYIIDQTKIKGIKKIGIKSNIGKIRKNNLK
jgi:hypothetical protein